jgi:UDP-N-acetyl-D-galactosamine dehydrogenase
MIAAVPHRALLRRSPRDYADKLAGGGLFVDVKCKADAKALQTAGVSVWRL